MSVGNNNGGIVDITNVGKNLFVQTIPLLRSNMGLIEKSEYLDSVNLVAPKVTESFCHTFYRIVGLPVISSNKTDFYNPGHYGSEDTTDEELRRLIIDKSQDQELLKLEYIREVVNDANYKQFNNKDNLNYKFEIISNPIKTNLLNKDKKCFEYDSQDDNKSRTNSKCQKILRPFKCNSAVVNSIVPVKNKLCAPFVSEENAKIIGSKLHRTYLEYIARMRFGLDVSNNSEDNAYKEELMNTITDNGVAGLFQENVVSLTNIESYFVNQLIISFIDVCKQARGAILDNQKIIRQVISNYGSSPKTQLDLIQSLIKLKEQEKAKKDLILSQLPSASQEDNITLRNPISCPISNCFISLVQNDVSLIEKQIQELNNQKALTLQAYDSINSDVCYILGEHIGIGIVDVLAVILSLWLLPQEQLVSLFDISSFERLYRNNYLRNEIVTKRYNQNKEPLVPISDVIQSIDGIVYNLLDFASDIIEGQNI